MLEDQLLAHKLEVVVVLIQYFQLLHLLAVAVVEQGLQGLEQDLEVPEVLEVVEEIKIVVDNQVDRVIHLQLVHLKEMVVETVEEIIIQIQV